MSLWQLHAWIEHVTQHTDTQHLREIHDEIRRIPDLKQRCAMYDRLVWRLTQ